MYNLLNHPEVDLTFSLGFTLSENITSIQRKIWNVLLNNARKSLAEADSFTIPLTDIRKLSYDLEPEIIREAIIKLSQCLLNWNIFSSTKKIGTEFCPLISYCKFTDKEIIYRYPHLLQDKLINSNRFNEKIDTVMENYFSSKHARNLFGICIDYLNFDNESAEITVSIKDLKLLLDISDTKYQEFKIFNRDILKKSIEEINEKSNVHIDITYKKKSNLTHSVSLFIQRKKSSNNTGDLFFTQKISIKNPLIVKFFERNKIQMSTVQSSLKNLFDMGLPIDKAEEYILSVKEIFEKNSFKNSTYFFEVLNKKHNIENYLQKLEAEKMEIENFKKLEELYVESQIDYARQYLIKRNDLFKYHLEDEKENLAIKILLNSLYEEELIQNNSIVLFMIPLVSPNADYKFISFEKWKKSKK